MIIPDNVKLPFSASKDFSLIRDGQQSLNISYFEFDVKNFPNSIKVTDKGISLIQVLHIDNLPPNLKKDETVVTVTFTANSDGSIDLFAVLKNLSGDNISSNKLSISKGSDLL